MDKVTLSRAEQDEYKKFLDYIKKEEIKKFLLVEGFRKVDPLKHRHKYTKCPSCNLQKACTICDKHISWGKKDYSN